MRTTKALAERIGITPRALGDVENGRRTNYAPGTKARIEIALLWRHGSIDAVLAGGEPTPLPADVAPANLHSERRVVDERRVIATLNEMSGHIGASLRAQADLFDWTTPRLADSDRRIHEEMAERASEPLVAATHVFAQFTVDLLKQHQPEGEENVLEDAPESDAPPEAVQGEEAPLGVSTDYSETSALGNPVEGSSVNRRQDGEDTHQLDGGEVGGSDAGEDLA